MQTSDNGVIMEQPLAPTDHFFRGQIINLLALGVLLAAAFALVDLNRLAERELLGLSGRGWYIVTIAIPVIHQIYVWLTWRSQLCYRTLSNRFGDCAFLIYQVIFMALLLARPISLSMLATVDHDSMAIPLPIRIVICLVLGAPAIYAMYSVVRYFGLARAAGKDHFDASYRGGELVTGGIYRYTDNAMYLVVFLGVWVIAIAGASWAALVAAGFSHAAIWVHYYCTEQPDMRVIYGAEASDSM